MTLIMTSSHGSAQNTTRYYLTNTGTDNIGRPGKTRVGRNRSKGNLEHVNGHAHHGNP